MKKWYYPLEDEGNRNQIEMKQNTYESNKNAMRFVSEKSAFNCFQKEEIYENNYQLTQRI